MGHIEVLSCDLKTHLLFTRYDGGANGYERDDNYQSVIKTNTDHQAIGVQVVTGGITFVASQATYEAVSEDITTNGAGASYTLPNGLTIAAATVKSENDTTSSEYTANHYEASMAVATGLTAVVTVSDFDYENGTEGSAADENGTTTKLSIKASF